MLIWQNAKVILKMQIFLHKRVEIDVKTFIANDVGARYPVWPGLFDGLAGKRRTALGPLFFWGCETR